MLGLAPVWVDVGWMDGWNRVGGWVSGEKWVGGEKLDGLLDRCGSDGCIGWLVDVGWMNSLVDVGWIDWLI